MAFVGRWTMVGLLVMAACATDPTLEASVDGAADGGAEETVARPVIPWFDEGLSPVELTPCPTGWRLVADREPEECDPYPEAGPEACSFGAAHFPGEPGCRAIGSPCPTGEFADSLPTDGTLIHVRAGAPPGGDGTETAPYGALSAVPWLSLSAGTTVALGKGLYPGVVPLKAGVRVVGACAAETILTGLEGPVRSVITVTSAGDGAAVSNLSIRGAEQTGVWVEGGRSFALDGVLFESLAPQGIFATGAGTQVTLRDVLINGTRAGGVGGFAIQAESGAHIDASRLFISRSAQGGFLVDSAGTVVTATDTAIVDSVGLPDGRRGRGATVRGGARFELSRALFANNRDMGIIVGLAESEAVLEDVVIRDTQADGSGFSGRGMSAQDGGHITATRVVVAQSRDVGLFMSDPNTQATLRHVVVRDTQGQLSDGAYGRAISISDGPALDASNLVLVRNREAALSLAEGSSAVVRDALIVDTAVEWATSEYGRGIVVQDSTRLDASQMVIARNHDLGILVSEWSALHLEDAVIHDTLALEGGRTSATAIGAQSSASVTGSRIEITNAEEHGISAVAATVTMEDISITGIARGACMTGMCRGEIFGYGASALNGTLQFTRFRIDDIATCGVFLATATAWTDEASVDLLNGVVSNAEIGACVQSEGYDLERLTQGVEYRDNVTNLDITSLPLPGVADPSSAL